MHLSVANFHLPVAFRSWRMFSKYLYSFGVELVQTVNIFRHIVNVMKLNFIWLFSSMATLLLYFKQSGP